MAKYKASKFPGVRYREHKTRKHGLRFDRYFQIRYQRDGKTICESLGWASDGWSDKKASETLGKIKEAIRTGNGAQSLKESRDLAKKEREAIEQQELASITFSDLFNKTYLPIAQQDKKPKSWKTEDSWFRNWIQPVIGSLALADIAPIHIEKIKSNMLSGP